MFIIWKNLQQERGTLIIINNTSEYLIDVKIIYNTTGVVIPVGEMQPGGEFKHKIIDDREDSISIEFKDNAGNLHKDVIIGYVQKGMGSVQISIIYQNNNFSTEETSWFFLP